MSGLGCGVYGQRFQVLAVGSQVLAVGCTVRGLRIEVLALGVRFSV